MMKQKRRNGRMAAACAAAWLAFTQMGGASASDHLDTMRVVEDPAADIGDLFAWMSPDRARLNLVMTLVGHELSPGHAYAFHLASGPRFGDATTATDILCQPDAAGIECWVGGADHAHGAAGSEAGLVGEKGHFRVFAGLRDDPFYNNVKGSRDALNTGIALVKAGAPLDAARCPVFDAAASATILDRWQHTDGGPGTNFLAGWKVAALVVSVDIEAVGAGGDFVTAWGATYGVDGKGADGRPKLGRQVDRAGRTLTGNALLGLFADRDSSNSMKDNYNGELDAGAWWADFADEIQIALGFYDGLDHVCGNQWLAGTAGEVSKRYERLAELLLDDRLWIDSRFGTCERYMAVELNAFASEGAPNGANSDCGGRTPVEDAVDVFRSLLATGTLGGVPDGVGRDDHMVSLTEFPFLAAP